VCRPGYGVLGPAGQDPGQAGVRTVEPVARWPAVVRPRDGTVVARPSQGAHRGAGSPTPTQASADDAVVEADVDLDRDLFLRSLLRRLAGTLEDLVGLEETSGFISVVGDEIGHLIDDAYKAALGTERLDAEQVGAVLVDLKRRIEGDFRVVAQDEERIELRNRACPFAEHVVGRPSLCMMTSNVFGSITANNLGYARVELLETIAEGDPGATWWSTSSRPRTPHPVVSTSPGHPRRPRGCCRGRRPRSR
jgi:hypothetical protein